MIEQGKPSVCNSKMNLETLLKFIHAERIKLEKAISNKTKKLRVDDVLSEIKIDVSEYITYTRFKKGDRLDIRLYSSNYTIQIQNEKLIVYGPQNLKIKEYNDTKVKEFYDKTAAELLAAQEESDNNLPF